ncbi:MAG: GspMb/PilO family protein [Bryobacteraceae bacterium]
MKLQEREKRALIAAAVVTPLILWYSLSGDSPSAQVVGSIDNIPAAEKRLTRLKQITSTVDGKQKALAKVQTELDQRERGLIQADTAAQAQAQLLQVLRKVGRKQTPPVELRNTEIGQVKPFGDRYAEVLVAANFEARIEQLIEMLAEISAQRELIGTTDLRISAAHPKEKTFPVRLTVSGLVRRELVPDKKGTGTGSL